MDDKKRILVVEDNMDDSIMMAQVVELVMHYQATLAQDGAQAVQLAEDNIFDLILLDMHLPNVQGWHVAESIRQMDQHRNIPIIAVTAYDLAETSQLCDEAGCNAFLIKPIDVESLTGVIRKHLFPA